MPGFVVEEGFPLSRFQNTIGSTSITNKFIVDLSTFGSTTPSQDTQTTADDDQVVVTIQGEGIKLYNTTVQKCLKSWTAPPGILFGQPATYSPATGDETLNYTYALVDSGSDVTKSEERKTVWMWVDAHNNEEITSSANRVSKTFEERIQAVHVSPSLRFNVILVNENGSVDLVSKDLGRFTANYKAGGDDHVLWSTTFVTTSSHVRPCCVPNSMVPVNSTIVVTISNTKESAPYTVKLLYINEERRSINVAAKLDMDLKTQPVSFTFDPTLGILTILESDGTWTVNHLTLKHRSSSKIAAYLEKRSTIHFKNYQIYNDKLGNIASMAPLADNFVAFVAPRIMKKGSKVYEHVLSVWDVKYGTLQAEKVIKLADKQLSSGDCVCKVNILRNSHIAVTISSASSKTKGSGKSSKSVTDTKSVVTLLPYYNQPMSLMAAMNKMKPTADFLDIDMKSLSNKSNIGLTRSGAGAVGHSVKFEISDDHTFEKWTKTLKEDQDSEQAMMEKLMDPSITKKEFIKLFTQQVQIDEKPLDQNLDAPSDTIAEKLDRDVTLCLRAYNELTKGGKGTQLSSQFVSSVVDRIFAKKSDDKPDMTLWSPFILVYFMAKEQLRNEYIDGGLLRGLMDRDAWHLVPSVLKSVIDIPETDLMLLIKTLVEKSQNDPAVWESRFGIFMKQVVEAPRNDIFMQQALRQLTATELPVVLTTIIQWLKGEDKKSKPMKLTNGYNANLAKRNNIIDFTSALLDIHYPTIILDQSLHEMLEDLYDVLNSLSTQVEQMEELHGALMPFDRAQKIHMKQVAKRHADKAERKNAPPGDKKLARLGTHAKYGGEEGIPVYRVEMFQF
ncbi:hypothetical protein BC941DRAFT_384685 [Chlamydoabsidia padenii]|nr:hypothetical protein BC941DRAFT_384685 [Chlamydoabsidia padenii]